MTEPVLTAQGEQAWLRLKQHLEWCENFALVFVFSAHPAVVAVFRERLAAIWRARVTGLHVPLPESPEMLAKALLPMLLSPNVREQALNAPCWLDLSRFSEPVWQQARLNLLVRLNEQRESLRRGRNRPLVLVLPEEDRNMVRTLTPDLWSVRDFSLVTENWLSRQADEPLPEIQEQEQAEAFPLSEHELSLLAEWERVRPSRAREVLPAAERAFQVLLRSGRHRQAAAVADEMMAISRRIVVRTGETPESLRDLSVALNNVGQASDRIGAFDEARQAYQESLDISRRIVARTGETPESLRDLSVALNNVGQASDRIGAFDEARQAYQESLDISRRIVARTGETPESLRDLSVSLHKNGELLIRLGRVEEAVRLLQEGLIIAQTLEKAFPNNVDCNDIAQHFLALLDGARERAEGGN